MKPIFTLALFLVLIAGFSHTASADFDPMGLSEVIGRADLIAIGEIVEVREKTFILKVEEVWRGAKLERVEIEKFRNWACARRRAEYERGQRVLVFVEKKDDAFRFPGIGGEAESPIIGNDLYCQFPNGLPDQVKLGKHHAAKVRLSTVAAAIRDYPAYFRFFKDERIKDRNGGERIRSRIMETKSSLDIASFAKRSKFHQFLIDDTRSTQDKLESP